MICDKTSTRSDRTHSSKRQQDRQQQQVGKNQHRHTNAGCQGQVLDHGYIDHHQHCEPDSICHQCCRTCEEQPSEGVARRDELMCTSPDVLHDAIHLLHAMGNPDGEDEERNEHRIGVQIKPKRGHGSQLPYRRDDRTGDDQGGAAQAAGIGINDQRGDDGSDSKIEENLDQPIDQVAHQFGEPDHVDLDCRVFLTADPFLQRV
ncbi:hypothetical protein D3C85_681470 [compost metagenome]